MVPHVSIAVLHPLSTVPQFFPAGHAVRGVQVKAQVPFAQTCPLGHEPPIDPQFTFPPQPSGMVPQLRLPHTEAAVLGVHPQTLATDGVPPPQV